MNSIQGISSPKYCIATQTSKAPSTTTTQTASRTTVDSYVPGDAWEVQNEVKTVEFTGEMATAFADKYDPTSMSRNEYTKLIVELRDAGVLSSQEYSIAYSGKLLPSDRQVTWPQGSEITNFTFFLRECVEQCNAYVTNSGNILSGKEKSSAEEISATYIKLSAIFTEIEQAQTTSLPEKSSKTELSHFEATAAVKEYSDEVMRLYELLKQDTEYVARAAQTEYIYMGDWDYPVRDQLAKELLLSDHDLLEEFAMYTWGLDVENNLADMEWNAMNPEPHLQHRLVDVEPTYEDRIDNIKNKLIYGGKSGFDDVFSSLEGYLRKKALYQRLTEVEHLVFPLAAATERNEWYTFEERMKPVVDEVKNAFSSAGLAFDSSQNFQFYLDTNTFTFSVVGGTEEENKVFASVLNTNPTENYLFNPYETTINAMRFSRPDDMSYTPWELDSRSGNRFAQYNAKFFNMDESIRKYGIADVSANYTAKMNQLSAAYRRDAMDDNLHRRFGFGIEDFSYVDGQWIGKTDEITKLIESMNKYADWDKQIGDAYRNLMREYTGTPVFEKAIFVFINGKLQLTYEEWE